MTDALRHPDAEERRRAVAALGPDEIVHLLPELCALLDDPDWRVRREVALALSRMRDPAPAIEPLVDAVETGDVARRNAAIEALRHIGPVAAGPVLARLKRAQGGARRFLIEVLGDIGDETCVDWLSHLLDDADPNVSAAAAESLGRIRGPGASAALFRALSHTDPVVRLAALQAFSARGEALPWERLEPLMDDPICRRDALRAAALCRDVRALNAIVKALCEGNTALASEAVVACATAIRRGRREALGQALRQQSGIAKTLCHLAEHGSQPDVQCAAIEVLGVVGDPASVGTVLRAIERPETGAAASEVIDHFGTEAVSEALRVASTLGPLAMTVLLRWALSRAKPEDHSVLVQVAWRALESGAGAAAWEVIASVGSRDDALALIARLEANRDKPFDPSEYRTALEIVVARFGDLVPRLAVLAPAESLMGLTVAAVLAAAGYPVPLEPLREALTATDPVIRAAAVRALGASRHGSVRDVLEFALADEDIDVQAAAAEALGALDANSEVLEESLHAPEPRVRRAAVRAIARRGRSVRTVLLPLLDDPDPSVVLAVLEGLGGEATVEDLTGLITHPDPDVAVEALLRLRDRDARAASLAAEKLLDHPVWSVRLEAVRTIDCRRAEAVALLQARRIHERDELVRQAIDVALEAAGSVPPGVSVP